MNDFLHSPGSATESLTTSFREGGCRIFVRLKRGDAPPTDLVQVMLNHAQSIHDFAVRHFARTGDAVVVLSIADVDAMNAAAECRAQPH